MKNINRRSCLLLLGLACCCLSLTHSSLALQVQRLSSSYHIQRAASIGLYSSKGDAIPGLLPTTVFDKRQNLDQILRELKRQLPNVLMVPLTGQCASKVYDQSFQLVVVVDDENMGKEEIPLLKSVDELVALSDVLVLATSAAQGASNFLSQDSPNNKDASENIVDCQLWFLDDCDGFDDAPKSSTVVRIPWKTKIPFTTTSFNGRPNSNDGAMKSSRSTLQGLSEYIIDEASGKVTKHRLLNVTFDGTPMTGPAIGQALKTLQSGFGNVQQNPLFQTLVGSSSSFNSIFSEIRDGLLEQAATAVAARSKEGSNNEAQLFVLNKTAWTESSSRGGGKFLGDVPNKDALNLQGIPLPGKEDWVDYVLAHQSLTTFCTESILALSGRSSTSTLLPNLFSPNATLFAVDQASLIEGDRQLVNYFQILSNVRKTTGGTWDVTGVNVLSWENRTVSVQYRSTSNGLPGSSGWTIQGRDRYQLDPSSSTPKIIRIDQEEFKVSNKDESIQVNEPWVMRNIVRAIEQGQFRTTGVDSARDLIAEVILGRQPALSADKKVPIAAPIEMDGTAAANVYYIMRSLNKDGALLQDSSALSPENRLRAPAVDYLDDNIILKGYLGETILKGSAVYERVLGLVLLSYQQSLSRKQLNLLEKKVPQRVELTATGNVRFYQALNLKIPPPGALFLDQKEDDNTGVPLKLELVSDYVIDPKSGKVSEHRLLESRINGQLTPGDVVSRFLQRFLGISNISRKDGAPILNGNEPDLLSTVTDLFAWIRNSNRPLP